MDAKKYLEMSVEELNQTLIADVMANVSEVHSMVEESKAYERYSEDPAFRAFMDSAAMLASFTMGDYSVIFPNAEEMIRRTTECSLWNLVSLHWNLLGGAYLVYGVYEKAMEYYYRVIRNEKAHGLKGFLSLAYNNIAMLYMHFEARDKVRVYLELAIAGLKEGGEDQPRYVPKLLIYMSNLLIHLVFMKRKERATELMEEMNSLDLSQVSMEAFYTFYRGCMSYHIMFGDFETAHDFYMKARELYGSEGTIQLGLVSEYISQCQLRNADLRFYQKEIAELENFQLCHKEDVNMIIVDCLWLHYRQIGDFEKMSEFRDRYISVMEDHRERVRAARLNSVNMVDELLQKKDRVQEESSKNSELTDIAEEAIRHKNESQKAFRQVEIVHRLGQKLTSSMNLMAVVDLIYENLKENVPMNTFILMVSDTNRRQLRSVAYYEEARKLPEISFAWSDPESLFAQCFRTERRIVIADTMSDLRFRSRPVGTASVRSAVFMPLGIEGEVIGVYSLQDAAINSYTAADLEFLERLKPYLSIALNNAVRSWKLEEEIRTRMGVQERLEEANRKLQRLSSLDGLTQVSNRRDFEQRILKLLQSASEKRQSVAIFMFDIDHFKEYNDTYGHLKGDEVLKRVAETVRRNLDSVDGLSARFGGEEFIGACAGLSVEENRRLAEKICKEVRELEIEHSATSLGILTLSIGVSVGEGAVLSNKSILMRSADGALYEAKNTGKNRASVHPVFNKEEDLNGYC